MATLATLAYLAASVLFILALRGLSHPETSRQGNQFGMIGMAVAVVATILNSGMDFGGFVLIIAGLAIGGGISAIFLLSNFHAHLADCFPYGEGDAKRKMTLLLGAMAGFHFVLLVIFKIYFFAYA